MLNKEKTKKLLKNFAWECYEFWSNELDTDIDRDVWLKVIEDLQTVIINPFCSQEEQLDLDAKAEFINQFKKDLDI